MSYSSVTTGFLLFAECQMHSAKPGKHSVKSLPSVTLGKDHSVKLPRQALGKVQIFAECQDWALDKDSKLCRVPVL